MDFEATPFQRGFTFICATVVLIIILAAAWWFSPAPPLPVRLLASAAGLLFAYGNAFLVVTRLMIQPDKTMICYSLLRRIVIRFEDIELLDIRYYNRGFISLKATCATVKFYRRCPAYSKRWNGLPWTTQGSGSDDSDSHSLDSHVCRRAYRVYVKNSVSTRAPFGFCYLLSLLWLSIAVCPAAEIAGYDTTQGGFGKSAPVLAALEKFHRDHGQYPAYERELVPRYLPEDRTYGTYRRGKDGAFTLTFGYTRGSIPGLTVWTYHSSLRRWLHSGYY